MNNNKIASILSEIELEMYNTLFFQNNIDFDTFTKMKDEEFEKLGISNYFHRKVILNAIENNKKKQDYNNKKRAEEEANKSIHIISIFALLFAFYLFLFFITYFKIEINGNIVPIKGYECLTNFAKFWDNTNRIQKFFMLSPISCGICGCSGLCCIMLLLLIGIFADNKSKWNVKFKAYIFDVDYSTENQADIIPENKYDSISAIFNLIATPLLYISLITWFFTLISIIVFYFRVFLISNDQKVEEWDEIKALFFSYGDIGSIGFILATILAIYIMTKTVD